MQEILKAISQSPEMEARWLNTLSMMEFIGARKISKTVCAGHPSRAILEHYADEVRHSFAFKRLSEEVCLSASKHYLCEDEAASYFQTLDSCASQWLSDLTGETDAYASYLLTTALIERRAMKLYPLYMKATEQAVVRSELQKVILEEANHRQDIEDKLEKYLAPHGQTLESCLPIEDHLFSTFKDSLRREIGIPLNL